MIRVTMKAGNNLIQVEGETQMEVFKQASSCQETFGEKCCGKCKSTDLAFVVRTASDDSGDEYEYPELWCRTCGSKLKFGQSKGGELFPIRFKRNGKKYEFDDNGKKIPVGANGWVKYNHKTKQEE